MRIITPKGLECDAIVPQCLDNQYTSDAVLDRMLGKRAGSGRKLFDDPGIRKLRLEETHAEFIRSLLYSSTVVVNRAYLVNSEYLLRELKSRKSAIPALIHQRAIVPYLQKEKSLTEDAQYAQQVAGVKRLRELEGEGAFEDARCLRFSDDDKTNDGYVRKLGANFRQFSQDLKSVVESGHSRQLAGELYASASPGQRRSGTAVPAEVLAEFERGLREISRFVFDTGASLGRQDIYGRFFIEDGVAVPANVSRGLFSREMNKPSLRMLKKLIDLKYNANLPDLLGRYTLTPANLPGRSALPFELPPDADEADDAFKKLAELKGRIMDQRPEVLPRLRKLDLHQVLEIRALEEWQRFRASQEALLTVSPEGMMERFDAYQRDLLHFQSHLGKWAVHRAPRAVAEGTLCKTAINLTVKVGLITLFVALGDHGPLTGLNPLERIAEGGIAAEVFTELAKDKLMKLLEENGVTKTIEEWTVKLMVEVSDAKTNRFDKDHSYQLELIKSNARITRAELADMIQEVQQASGIGAAASTQFAEQSK